MDTANPSRLDQWGAFNWEDEIDELYVQDSPRQNSQPKIDTTSEGKNTDLEAAMDAQADQQQGGQLSQESTAKGHVRGENSAEQSHDETDGQRTCGDELLYETLQLSDYDVFDNTHMGLPDPKEFNDSEIEVVSAPYMDPDSVPEHHLYEHNDGSNHKSDSQHILKNEQALYMVVPYHPGWTTMLSPSLSPNHSTPPETNH